MERLAGRVVLLWGWRRFGLSLGAGALAALAQAPFDFPVVAFVSFPLLVWLLDGAVLRAPASLFRRAASFFAVGWWFGFGYFLAGLWWIGGALLVEADSFAWALPFAVVGLPLLLALFWGCATLLARPLWSGDIGRLFALAFGFGVAEWLRTWVLTGLPWNPIGFAAMPVPLLMQSAFALGTLAVNALAVLLFALPALLAGTRFRGLALSLGVALLALHAGYGAWRLNQPPVGEARTLSVRLVQPSIDLSEKWDGAVRDRILATTLDLSKGPRAGAAAPPDLVVWPETSVPFLLSDRPDALSLIGSALSGSKLLLAGAVRGEGDLAGDDARFYNSVVAVDSSGTIVDAVDKVHLVPFGEYIPLAGLLARVGLTQLVAGPMNFMAGASRHLLDLPGGLKAAPFICYEVIFPAEVARGAEGADLLLNITNDAWFGDTPGPYQHFRQLQLRAVETGLPALRAANNGVSGVVDSHGRVLDALALNERGRIDAEMHLYQPQPPILPHLWTSIAVILTLAAAALVFRFGRLRRSN